MEEFGTASYYAEQFHGKKTANGERFNMNDLLNLPGATAELTTPGITGWMASDIGGGPRRAADGRGDLVYVDHVPGQRLSVYSLMSTGDGKWRRQAQVFPVSATDFPARYEARYWIPTDVNGDGRTDLVHICHVSGQAKVQTLLSTGDGSGQQRCR